MERGKFYLFVENNRKRDYLNYTVYVRQKISREPISNRALLTTLITYIQWSQKHSWKKSYVCWKKVVQIKYQSLSPIKPYLFSVTVSCFNLYLYESKLVSIFSRCFCIIWRSQTCHRRVGMLIKWCRLYSEILSSIQYNNISNDYLIVLLINQYKSSFT